MKPSGEWILETDTQGSSVLLAKLTGQSHMTTVSDYGVNSYATPLQPIAMESAVEWVLERNVGTLSSSIIKLDRPIANDDHL